ncbi:hypothetical protein UXP65_14835, partial [Enterobacter kobei]
MKHLFCLLPLLVPVSLYVSANEMNGFATQYYDEDGSLAEISTTQPLIPIITIGKKTVQMEVTHLADISSTPVNKDSSAHQLTKTVLHTGPAFMTTMARIIGLFLITKWEQDCSQRLPYPKMAAIKNVRKQQNMSASQSLIFHC